MASGTAWQSPLDGHWLQSLSVDFSSLQQTEDKTDLPRDARSCDNEIERLREKNTILRRKVRRAKGEERRDADRISLLESEINVLESRLAEKLQGLKDDVEEDGDGK